MINKHILPIALGIMFTNEAAFSQKIKIDSVTWEKIATLPQMGMKQSIGVAGPINAVHQDALVVAGGANFPDKMPWEGGEKHYSDQIYLLQKKNGSYIWNNDVTAKLPEPIAYAGNTSTSLGIVYAGGENRRGISDKAYLIRLEPDQAKLNIESLPDLPLALSNVALTSIKNVVYAIGGDKEKISSCSFFSLDLDSEVRRWKSLSDLPLQLANSLAITQTGPDGINIYVIGGRAKTPSGISDLSETLYIYNPGTQKWKRGAPLSNGIKVSNFSAGNGIAVSENLILITGGDNGEVFHQIETYLSRISKATDPQEKSALTTQKNQLITSHQGFDRGILVYNTLTDSWKKIGDLPFPARVTTTATKWGENIILSSGEIRPGIRTPDIMMGTVK